MRGLRCTLITLGALLSLLWGAKAQLDVERVMIIGQNALYFKDYIVSIGYFNQVIEVRPWMAEPYFHRAVSKYMLGDYRGAELDASLALERNAFISRAYVLRGVVRQALGEYKGAITDLKHSLYLAPDDADIAFNLAAAQLSDKQYNAADTTISTLIKRHPKHAIAHLLRADILLNQQDTLQATEELNRSLALDSTQAQAYAFRAMLASKKENYKSALLDLNRALQLAPSDKNNYINRGLTRYQLNDYVGAIEDYTAAINLAPSDPVARYNRALLRATVGDANNALEDLAVVLEVQPNNYMALYNRGLLSLEVGDFRTALKSFDKVLSKYPNFQMGLLARADAKRGLGDAAGADRDSWQAYQQQKKQIKKKASSTSKSTRSETEEAIERYNELVETSLSASTMGGTTTLPQSLRGRVQDAEVAIVPFGTFSLNYYHATPQPGIPPRVYYSQEVTSYNEAHPTQTPRLLVAPSNRILDSVATTELRQSLSALDAQPKEEANFYLRRGITSLLLIDFDRAIDDFDHALSLDKKNPLAYFVRSAAWLRRLEVRQHTTLTTPSPSAPSQEKHNGLGISIPTKKEQTSPSLRGMDTVLDDLDKAIELAPKFAYAYYNRAIVYLALGQKEKALEDYSQAITLGGTLLPEAYFNRGLLFLSMGQKDKAIADLSLAGEQGIFQAYNIIKRIQEQL